MYRKLRIDILLLLGFVVIPVIMWAFLEPLSIRYSNSFMIFTSFGQLTGIIGMTLVSLSMIFQVRNLWLSKVLAKPTTLLNIHHETALWGLYLLILHPLLLAARLVQLSPRSAAEFLITTNFINLTGLIAILIMIASLFVTLFVSRNFRYWKLTHQMLLVAYAFILYHLLFVRSDISANMPLRIYILGLAVLGGLSFAIQKTNYYLKKAKIV